MSASPSDTTHATRRGVRVWFMRSESARGYALLSPTLVVVVLGLVFPLIILITLSFWKQDYVNIIRTFTFENYFAFFEKKIYYLILYRSIRISAFVTLVTIVLAYPLAYYIAFHVQKNKIMWIIHGHDPVLDQLPAARVRVEGDSRLQRRHQFGIHVSGPDFRTAPVPALQPDRGGDHARARLGGGGHPSDLRVPGEDRPVPHRGRTRPGRECIHDFRARHTALVIARASSPRACWFSSPRWETT